jgi:protease I
MASYAAVASGRKILIITGDFVESNQLLSPLQCFQAIGYQVHTTSPDKNQGDKIITTRHVFEGFASYTEKLDQQFELSFNFSAIDIDTYDALVLPGGRAPEILSLNAHVLEHVRKFAKTNKPIAAIGHGALILAVAGVVSHKRCTSYFTCAPTLTAAGAQYTEVGAREIVIDESLITASSWQANHRLCASLMAKLGTQIIHRTLDELQEIKAKEEKRRKQEEESKKP